MAVACKLLCIPVRKDSKLYTNEKPVSYIQEGNALLFWSCMNPVQVHYVTVAERSTGTHFTDVCTTLEKVSNFHHIHFIHLVQIPNLDNFLGQQTHKPCE